MFNVKKYVLIFFTLGMTTTALPVQKQEKQSLSQQLKNCTLKSLAIGSIVTLALFAFYKSRNNLAQTPDQPDAPINPNNQPVNPQAQNLNQALQQQPQSINNHGTLVNGECAICFGDNLPLLKFHDTIAAANHAQPHEGDHRACQPCLLRIAADPRPHFLSKKCPTCRTQLDNNWFNVHYPALTPEINLLADQTEYYARYPRNN